MNQPIAGVVPPEVAEVTSMTVWPSIAATSLGRLVGQLCSIRLGVGRFFTLGKLMALATIPLSLVLYFLRICPIVARRYRISNRRVGVQRGLTAVDGRSIGLDEFDDVVVRRLPGQAWLRAGEVLFLNDSEEVFRLSGVLHPESFRHACLEASTAFVAVRKVVEQQAAAAG